MNIWQGPGYGMLDNMFGGKKVLILGESQYSSDAPERVGTVVANAARDTVDYWLTFKWEKRAPRFHNNLIAAVFQRSRTDVSQDEIRRFWSSVAFTNFVTKSVGTAGRQRPTPAHFRDSQDDFREVIRVLEPDVVLVCGFAIWRWIKTALPGGVEAIDVPVRTYLADGILYTLIKHPSAAFNWRHWKPSVAPISDGA